MLFTRFRNLLFSVATLFCGANDAQAIVSGSFASSGEFPWMAGIVRKGSFTTTALIGGGSLVGDQWILTTAHGLQSVSPGSIQVWLGMTDLDDPSTRIVRNVLAIYSHPDFTDISGQGEGDLALLLLDRPVLELPTAPILTEISDLASGDSLVVAGFGTTDHTISTPSRFLLKAVAEIIEPTGESFPRSLTPQESRLAAVDPDTVATPCRGDSGGPLLKNIDGTNTLVGLVSSGSFDCDPDVPSVYTNVAFYSDWIQEILSLTDSPPAIALRGRGRTIENGDASPSRADGTRFGRRRSRTTKSFLVENPAPGLLTIRNAFETHRHFKFRAAPVKVVGPSGASAFSLTYTPRKKKKRRSRAWVYLYTNDPAAPVYSFRVSGRPKKPKTRR